MKSFLSHSRYFLWSILTLVFITSCSNDRDEILGPDSIAALPPTVTAFTPANNSSGISPVAPGITVTFSEPMAPITGDASFTVTCQAPCTNPEGTVSLNGSNTVATYTLNAGSELEGNTTYTATISEAASLETGLTLEQATAWTFTTAARPQVIAVAPVNNATNVPVNNTVVTAEFTEPMAPLTGDASFTLTCEAPCTNPTGTVNLDATNEVATFSLNAELEPDTLYTATVTAGESLQTGLVMAAPFVWSFTTGLMIDTTRPQVTQTTPETAEPGPTLDVQVDTGISAIFTEDMAPITITNLGTFTLTCEAPCVSPDGLVSYSVGSRTATFTLTPEGGMLEPNTTYTATITTAATDLAGNALAGNQDTLPAASDYIWTFTTVARPTVIAFTPTNNATGVSPDNPDITATFSEPMAPITGDASFTVTCGAPCTNPGGNVSLDASNTVATFALNAGSELEENTTYTATLDGAQSLETGLTLAEPTVWSFTTSVNTDTPPQVTAVAPVNNATDVPVNSTVITAEFTEPVAPLTGDASFTVTCQSPCISPTGTVSLDATNEVATYTLTTGTQLEGNTLYTATVAGAQSLETGLTMTDPFVWSFTTGLTPDTTRPRVTTTIPNTTDPGPTPDVSVNSSISATFTEDMAPITITDPGTFTLSCESPCVSPAGVVSYSVGSRTATFSLSPSGAELEPDTTYTATITTAATDLAGNALAGNQEPLPSASSYIWTFTTVARPTVIAFTPANTATGVSPTNPDITVTFSEPMAPITGDASFTVTCEAPCINPSGTVSLDASNTVATFILTTGTELEGNTTYTATVDGAQSLETGLTLEAPTVWSFATAARPTVIAFTPANNATQVSPVEPDITATFSEPMAPITGDASFTVTCESPCTNPDGTVSLDGSNTTATFTLVAGTELLENTTYTATVTGAESLATGLTLAEPTVWSFTTATRPRVTAVAPVNNATGVATNLAEITAEFTEPVAPLTGDASFTVTCEAPCTSPTGTVSLDASNTIASFTLTTGTELEEETIYTATVTAAESLETGLTMAAPFVWSFTTGLTPDTTRPRVSLTVPETTDPGPTIDVPINTSITATFTEDMEPTTITAAGTFTLTCEAPCVSPDGVVSYSVGSRTATFALTPEGAELEPGTTYTATITIAATDLAGNALAGNQAALPAASDYIWTFTTVFEAVPPADITVFSVKPANADVGVCPNATINATFNVPSGLQMDPATINALTFTVFETNTPLNTVTAGSVVLDGPNHIATFTPQNDLFDGTEYTATVKGGQDGVKDLADPANIMVEDFVWSFHVGPATGDCLQPVSLNTAAPFGMLAGTAGMTNQGIQTIVNGDLGSTATATTAITGFRDSNGDVYTVTGANDGIVNGIIFSCTTSTTGPTSAVVNADNCNAATAARNDAIDAFNELAALPAGPDPAFGSPKGNLANEILAPGVYTSESGSFLIEGGDLTLDAQGDANAVWVFQMATTLTVGGPGVASPQSIILINGAQPKNVFWQVGSSATINAAGGGTMVGTIIASTGVTFSTAGNVDIITLDGRAMSLNASVTVVDTIINVPAQ